MKQSDDSPLTEEKEKIPMKCGWVELDDESKMDWSQVQLPKRSIKAILKEKATEQRQKAWDLAEKSTKVDTNDPGMEELFFDRDKLEIYQEFGQLAPKAGQNLLNLDSERLIFEPICPDFIEQLAIFLETVEFR